MRFSRRALIGGCGTVIPGYLVGKARAQGATPDQLKNTALDRLFAEAMHSGMADYEEKLRPLKSELFGSVVQHLVGLDSPTVLEVGIGTGPNLRYLQGVNNMKIIGLDPNPFMRPYLEEEAARVGLQPVDMIPGVAEAMPIASTSIDLVICTLVLCSVTDVSRALTEMARVLKPDGRLLIVEHVRAGKGLTRFAQAVFNPLQQLLADGCHLDRDFSDEAVTRELFDLSTLQATEVPDLSLLSHHKFGVLQKV